MIKIIGIDVCQHQPESQLELFAPFDFTNKQARHDYERQVNQQIGILIRSLRRKHGLTQKQLGEVLGVSYQQIQKYECGKSSINIGKFSIFIKNLRY